MQLYYGYKTTNLTNNRFYYGVHKCRFNYDIFGDSYFGSGKILKQAIKKNGLKNFSKELIFIFANRKDAYDWERELVTQDFIDSNPLCYNIKAGGYGGFPRMSGENHPMFGRHHSEKTKQKLRISKLSEKNPSHGGLSDEHKKKIAKSMQGKHLSRETKQKRVYYLWAKTIQCRELIELEELF